MQYRANVGILKVFPNILLNILAMAFAAVALTGCGGGGGAASPAPPGTWVDPRQRQDVIAAYSPPGGQHALAFNRLNEIRGQLGLGLVRQDVRLDQAAQGHALWMEHHVKMTHFQTPGTALYTGTTAADRARAKGYPFPVIVAELAVGGVLSSADPRVGETEVNGLMRSPAQRAWMLRFKFDDIGIGFQENARLGISALVVKLGQNPGQGAPGVDFVVWPPNGAMDVMPRVADRLVAHPLNDQPFGYAVSIHTHEHRLLEVERFEIRDMSGNVFATRLLTHTTWPAGFGGERFVAAVVGTSPWPANTVLVAEFRGTIDGRPVGHQWNFTTGQ